VISRYIFGRVDQQTADRIAEMERMIREIHSVLTEFRPVLDILKPGGGSSDLQRAGVLRSIRKARNGRP
jgi:hypothetical protein